MKIKSVSFVYDLVLHFFIIGVAYGSIIVSELYPSTHILILKSTECVKQRKQYLNLKQSRPQAYCVLPHTKSHGR